MNELVVLHNHAFGMTTVVGFGYIQLGHLFLSYDERHAYFKEHAINESLVCDIEKAIAGLLTGSAEKKCDQVARFCFLYCHLVADNKPVKDILVSITDINWAFKYCTIIGDDDDMRQVIIDHGDPKMAYLYCLKVKHYEVLYRIVLNSKNASLIDAYHKYVYNQNARQPLKPLKIA